MRSPRLHAAAEYGPEPVFHLAPPLITRIDKATGRRKKIAISGKIALPLFRALRHGKMPCAAPRWTRSAGRRIGGWSATLIRDYERDL